VEWAQQPFSWVQICSSFCGITQAHQEQRRGLALGNSLAAHAPTPVRAVCSGLATAGQPPAVPAQKIQNVQKIIWLKITQCLKR
jgi:hypothetical protein